MLGFGLAARLGKARGIRVAYPAPPDDLPPAPEGFAYVVDGDGDDFVQQGAAYVVQEI
jgi:hypothetical protein